ncbi:MAG TPA: GYF domain-containing protein, partial [Thermoanaerobaculia bacterium]|nr:GYF domain-containing protein [Thermoanaerobaculia bacterium]
MANGEQWYMVIGGHQVGPVSADEIAANLKNGSIDAGTLVYTQGMENWAPLSSVPRFAAGGGAAPVVPAVPGKVAHEIDFQIFGTEMQFVEVELDPGESAIAEAGVLMY